MDDVFWSRDCEDEAEEVYRASVLKSARLDETVVSVEIN